MARNTEISLGGGQKSLPAVGFEAEHVVGVPRVGPRPKTPGRREACRCPARGNLEQP